MIFSSVRSTLWKQPSAALVAITLLYIGCFIWLDSRINLSSQPKEAFLIIPFLFCLTGLSWGFRCLRWRFLLFRAGSDVSMRKCIVPYVAGFAFTATPGKVGELVRIRYFGGLEVPSWLVVSAFIYERVLDILVVLILCSFSLLDFQGRIQVLFFVLIIVFGIVLMVKKPVILDRVMNIFRFNKFVSSLVTVFKSGVLGIGLWSKWLDFVISVILGLLAWIITSFSFVLLLNFLNVEIPILIAISIYPLAMLVGAASMLPGGLGSTEAAIVLLLTANQVQFDTAVLASIIIRLGTLWFATICGVFSMIYLDILVTSEKVQNES